MRIKVGVMGSADDALLFDVARDGRLLAAVDGRGPDRLHG